MLKLLVEKHPNPYSTGWIKAGEKIEVKEQCKVPFFIGRYQDEVYFDVVDMDTCQLLFGRPWQFDLDAQHAIRENVYWLEKDRVTSPIFVRLLQFENLLQNSLYMYNVY